jgi:hypothetical protein
VRRAGPAAAALAAVAALACPAGAQGAYAPKLEVQVDPATPNAPAALVTTLTQAPGESANRAEAIRFPKEFRFNPGFAVVGCRRHEEDASACPESSRIGTSSAQTEFGAFSGPVYLTDDFRFLIFLRGFAGLLQSKIVGVVRVTDDGSVETVLEDLPAVRSTFAQVRMEAGPKSLILTPRRCGAYPVRGRFVSHGGELATSDAVIDVAGCDSEPRIVALGARPRARRVTLAWSLSEAGARTEIRLDRRIRTRPWERWRRVTSATGPAAGGSNSLRLGAARFRRLPRGLYRATLTAFSGRGRPSDIRAVRVRLR